jgi:hypothetical protein
LRSGRPARATTLQPGLRSFLLGILPPRCQAHVNGAQLLDQLVADESAALAERARVLRTSWPAREPRALADLERLRTCVAEAQLGVAAPAGLDASLFEWAASLQAAVTTRQAALCGPAAREDDRLAGYQLGLGHRLGSTLGELLAALEIGIVAHLLLEVVDDERLLAQLEVLAEVQTRGIPALGDVLSLMDRLNQTTRITGRLLLVLTKAPKLDGRGEHRGRASALQAVVRAVGADVPLLEDEAAQLLTRL